MKNTIYVSFKTLSFFESGFNLGVNKQLMTDVSGLRLGPPRLPLTPCPQSVAKSVLQKYKSVFPEC